MAQSATDERRISRDREQRCALCEGLAEASARELMHVPVSRPLAVVSSLFECKSSEEERVVYKKLNSTATLIQRTTMEAPQQICITSDSTFTRRRSAIA
jgi:hypothetical protein